MAVFHNGAIRHTAVIAYGGDYITRDIAMGLRTPVDSAERIKIEHGAAHQRAIGRNEFLEIPGVGGRDPPRNEPLYAGFDYRPARGRDFLGGTG